MYMYSKICLETHALPSLLAGSLKKQAALLLSTESSSFAWSTVDDELGYVFSFRFGKKLFLSFIVLLHCPVMSNKQTKNTENKIRQAGISLRA